MKKRIVKCYELPRRICLHIFSLEFLCFLFAIISVYQIVIKLELAVGIMPIFNDKAIDLFYNISISYLSGYVLWLLTTFLPGYSIRSVQREKFRSKIRTSYVLFLGLINKYRTCNEILLDDPSILEGRHSEAYKIKVQEALTKTNIPSIIDELQQNRFLPFIKQTEMDNIYLLYKSELRLCDSLIKNLTLLYTSSKKEHIQHYLTHVMEDLFNMQKF